MLIQSVKISDLSPNTGQVEGLPKNPRIIKDERYRKLLKSIQEDPEMLQLREVIAYKYKGLLIVIAGNMRLKACKELGFKEIPCKILPEDTPLQKLKAYTIKDNVAFGDHDFELLELDWELEELEGWGVEMPVSVDEIEGLKEDEIDENINKFSDENCELPIVPTFHEKYSYFIILTENEIDEAFLRNKFDLEKKHTSHKKTDDRLSNIISFQKIQEICLK